VFLTTSVVQPTRIIIPVIILLGFGTATIGVRKRIGGQLSQIVSDLLYGMNLFVARFLLEVIVGTSDVWNTNTATSSLVILIALTFYSILLGVEIEIERVVFSVAHVSSPATVATVQSWVNIVNRLMVFVLIQLFLGQLAYVFAATPTALVYIFPLVLLYGVFLAKPKLSRTQSDVERPEKTAKALEGIREISTHSIAEDALAPTIGG
jgi:hypothetical protein